MIAVTSEFPDAKLVLVGPDYAGYGPQLEERALSLGIPQSLIIYGPISDNEFEAEAIASCDVFIMPSRFEGFSQAVLKALAQGKPVVVSQTGGLPYEVGYGECGLLCKFRDSNALANSIIRLLVDEDLCKRIGDAGRKRAGSFTFDRLGADLASTYNRFLENS
jgi:D-inositol-3-phosphate glycosyltransferase